MIAGPEISRYLVSPEVAKRSLSYQLKIAGEPVTEIRNLSYEADGPALVLDCTLPFRVSRSVEGKDITVDLRLGPGLYRTFTGEALRPEDRSFQAASASFWDPIIDEDKTFSDAAPRSVAYYALLKRDYSGIDVAEPESPKFTRTGEDLLPWITTVSEILDALEEEAGLLVLDDGRNVARGFLTSALEVPGEPLFRWTTDTHLRGFSHSPRFSERYSEVRVYRTLPSGGVEEMAKAAIDNGRIRPPAGQVLTIEISDSDAADIYQRAREQAYEEATRRAEADEEGSCESVFIDPRLERGDSGVITEVAREMDGIYTSVYAVKIKGFSHVLVEDGSDVKEATYELTESLLSETVEEATVDTLYGTSVGVPAL